MTRRTNRGSSARSGRGLAGCCGGLLLLVSGQCFGSDALGSEADAHHPPLPDTIQPALDFAFKGPIESVADDLVLCTHPCSSPAPVISANLEPSPTYKQNFSVGLGQTGPVSFEISGSRLRMELAF